MPGLEAEDFVSQLMVKVSMQLNLQSIQSRKIKATHGLQTVATFLHDMSLLKHVICLISGTHLWAAPSFCSRSNLQEQALQTRLQHSALGMRPAKLGRPKPTHICYLRSLEGPTSRKLHVGTIADAT